MADNPERWTEIAIFESDSGEIAIRVDGAQETVWANQAQIAEMFGCTQQNIQQHLNSIYETGEVTPEATNKKILLVRREGDRDVKREIDHYNLDVVLSIGYRVNSKRATAFRQWANRTLSKYIINGFAVNEDRIADDEQAQKDLVALIRRVRTEEKVLYRAVCDVFKASSSDYDANSQSARTFFSTAQDKFHYAVSQKTAAQIKMERVNSKRPDCGLTQFRGQVPTVEEALIAKNYLDAEELRSLENLSEQWLLYAEGKAMRGQKMTMGELLQRINQLLEFNGYPVMWEYPKNSNAHKADEKVKNELKAFKLSLAPSVKPLPPKED